MNLKSGANGVRSIWLIKNPRNNKIPAERGFCYLAGDGGIGHGYSSADEFRDPASRRRVPTFDSYREDAIFLVYFVTAGDGGIGPPTSVLETEVMPLN